ncbi:MAG: DNA-binding response regulator [Magnetospirillum sp.]|nr:DNA-binding response regulator [Magnetospirillum sp.]
MPDRARILFVDDEVRVLEALRRSLRPREGRWEMAFLSSPAEALAAFRLRPFDVVVTDMKMPGMSGIEMVMAMRQSAPQAGAAYIVLTGTADLRTAIDAINKAEIFRFFTKPCPSFLLAEGIEAALEIRKPSAVPASATMGETALDRLAVAVLVVNSQGRVLFMNRRGGRLCAAGNGIVLGPNKIFRASTPAETARLSELIVSAIGGGEGGVMSLTRAEAGPLSVAVTALDGDCGAEAKAALYICDPDDHPIPMPEQLERLLDLTAAEARLAHALALGQSVEEAAGAAGITVGTARGYLKLVFAKTGKSRQAELVRLILSLPVVAD